jgi:ABC-2 type transport system permease protein
MKYIRLWLALAKNSIIRQLEYRSDFFGGLLLETAWISSLFIFYKSIFSQVDKIGNWREPEMMFFAASLFLVDAFYMVLLSKNSQSFPETIRSGIFDFYLLRPVSALFISTFRYINITGFFNVSMAIYLAVKSGVAITPLGCVIWVVYCFVGFSLLYSLLVIVASMAFWITQTSSLQWLFFELYRLGHRPDDIYVRWLQRVLLFAFPAAFFISIPVKLALGKLDGWWFVWPILWTAFAGFIASVVWKRGLRVYEGALS